MKTEWHWHKQTCRPVEQNGDPKGSTCNFNHLIFDKVEKNTLKEIQHLQQMVLEKVDVYLQKNIIRPISVILHKN